jgi:hypothetical protein
MDLHDQFNAWLAGPEGGAFIFTMHNSHTAVIRVRKNADFEDLYYQRNFNSSAIERGDSFQYGGIYCRRDGLLYDRQYGISELAGEGRGAGQLLTRLEADVRGAVEAAIGNDRGNLRVKELTDQCKIEHLEHFEKYGAASKARERFLSDADGAFAYRCAYSPPPWTEDALLDYILDPEGYTAREAGGYIKFQQETILYAFMVNSAAVKEYIALAGNPRHPAHRVKAIMRAMSATAAKTVRVTIRRDSAELTFKTEADELRRDCGSTYSTWHVAAADRQAVERLAGRGGYGPEDIVRIEYGKAVLYEAGEVGS